MKVIIERASWEYCGPDEYQSVEGAVQMDVHKNVWGYRPSDCQFEGCHGLHEVEDKNGDKIWIAAKNEPDRVWVVEVTSIADLVLQVGPCVVYPPNDIYEENLFSVTIYDDLIE